MARPHSPATPAPSTPTSRASTLPERRASSDNVCLGMDEDLENQLEGRRSEERLEKEEDGKPPPVAHHHPATLEADDWESELGRFLVAVWELMVPADPRNWPVRKKVVFDVIMCTQVLSLTYASTAYVRLS